MKLNTEKILTFLLFQTNRFVVYAKTIYLLKRTFLLVLFLNFNALYTLNHHYLFDFPIILLFQLENETSCIYLWNHASCPTICGGKDLQCSGSQIRFWHNCLAGAKTFVFLFPHTHTHFYPLIRIRKIFLRIRIWLS